MYMSLLCVYVYSFVLFLEKVSRCSYCKLLVSFPFLSQPLALLPAGLADPWATGGSKQEAEPPPSYDDITGGAIADPWATNVAISVPPVQSSQPVPLTDPWGGFPSSASAAPPPQPQAAAE